MDDWYKSEQGTIYVDFDGDQKNTISLLLKEDGTMTAALHQDGKAHPPAAGIEEIEELMRTWGRFDPDHSYVKLGPEVTYLVKFDDADREDVIFTGPNAQKAAMHYYHNAGVQWNAHLFVKIDSNSKDADTLYPSAELVPAEGPFKPHWPEGLFADDIVQFDCDDKGGNGGSWCRVLLSRDGDVHLCMQDWEERPEGQPNPIPTLRVRNGLGGGRNSRVHQALLWLALAAKLDKEDADKRNGHEPQTEMEV